MILRGVHGTASVNLILISELYNPVSKKVSSFRFWPLANQFPHLVSRMHVQVRLMGNFGLNGSLPWLQNTDGAICFIYTRILKV